MGSEMCIRDRYGGRLYDLLNNKNKLQVFDDSKGITQIYGLQEI